MVLSVRAFTITSSTEKTGALCAPAAPTQPRPSRRHDLRSAYRQPGVHGDVAEDMPRGAHLAGRSVTSIAGGSWVPAGRPLVTISVVYRPGGSDGIPCEVHAGSCSVA